MVYICYMNMCLKCEQFEIEFDTNARELDPLTYLENSLSQAFR